MAFHSAQKLKFSLLTTSSFLYFALIVIFLLLLSRAIYNRYFHPLSVYPGPFWASITDFNKFYTINSIPTSGLHLHKKHGKLREPLRNILAMLMAHRPHRSHCTEPAVVFRPKDTSQSISCQSGQDSFLFVLDIWGNGWDVPNNEPQGSRRLVKSHISIGTAYPL